MPYIKLAVEACIEKIEKGEGGPFGATIVRNNEVVVSVGNTTIRDTDPSAHAELVAIREACHLLGRLNLSDCEIYATCEPCPMCVGVILWANIKKVYYVSSHKEAAKYGFSDAHLREALTEHKTDLLEMIQLEPREDCNELWKTYVRSQGE